ncbi:hypothetical protein Ndes2526A_g03276 [Nannochloris sp. 'desiccata']
MVRVQVANSNHVSAVPIASEESSNLVLQALSKRLRNARKRLRGIDEIQAKADAGQALNSDQEGALLSRSSVLAIIEELERLQTVLEIPLKQELEAARTISRAEGAAEASAAAAAAAAAAKPPKPPKSSKDWEKEKKAAVIKARAEATIKAQTEAKTNMETAVKKASEDAINLTLQSLLELLYFSSLLDPYAPYSAERAACLYSAHQSQSSLTQDNINTLCYVGRLLTMKSYYSRESHRDTLTVCKDIALRIISQPDAQLHPTVQQGITGKSLKQTVEAIKALDFFTLPPGQPAAAVPAVPTRAAGVGGAPVEMGSAVAIGHAQHTQQQSHVPASCYGVENLMQATMPAGAGLPQYPQQQQREQQQRQSLPTTPALPVSNPAAPLLPAAFVQKQHIQIPAAVPTPQAAPEVAVEKIKKEENLMNTIFGGAVSGAAVQYQQQQSSGALLFNGDFQLGIEGVPLEVETHTNNTACNEKTKSDTSSLFAPTRTALPTRSPHVLTVPVSVAAKKRRNHSSRGSSQSRGSGAGPVLPEAGDPGAGGEGAGAGGNIKAFGSATKGRGGNAKKQALQQGKPAVQQQQQQEQYPPAPLSGSRDAAMNAEPRRPNNKNGYYRSKPRMQQSEAQPQQA